MTAIGLICHEDASSVTDCIREVILPTVETARKLGRRIELLVADNSASRQHDLISLLDSLTIPHRYLWSGGNNLMYGGALNVLTAAARSKHFIYICARHTVLIDPTWLADILGPLEASAIGLAGSVREVPLRGIGIAGTGLHVQGGVFAARTQVLKQFPYCQRFPHEESDVWLSQQVLGAGLQLAEVPSVGSSWRTRLASQCGYKVLHQEPPFTAKAPRRCNPMAKLLEKLGLNGSGIVIGGRTGAAALGAWRGKVAVKLSSQITEAADGSLDLLYLDGDPGTLATAEVLAAWWSKLRSGGVIGGHGFTDGSFGSQYGVRAAVQCFAADKGLNIRLTLDPLPTWFAVKGESSIAPYSLKLGVLTAYPATDAPLAAKSTSTKAEYCRRHGYDFIERKTGFDRDRHPAWAKIKFLREALSRYDWICWSDAASAIMNPKIPLESFLPVGERGEDLILGLQDVGVGDSHVCMGQFLIHNSPWSHKFLADWYALDTFDNDAQRERRGLIHLIESRDLSSRVRLVPQRWFNACGANYHVGDFSFSIENP